MGVKTDLENATDIRLAYKKMRLMYPECDHIILAYAMKNYTGYCDMGEYGAGAKILDILTQRGMNNTALFVTREYGGIQTKKVHLHRKSGKRGLKRTIKTFT